MFAYPEFFACISSDAELSGRHMIPFFIHIYDDE
jgi:hypothetical protein